MANINIIKNITTVNRTVMSGRNIKYIVIHYTGNNTDKASSNANYLKSTNRGASAHYFVDATSIYQVVEDKDAAWAVGRNYGSNNLFGTVTNRNSISIEMCSTNGKIDDKTFQNTVDLTKYLMKKYGISASHVYRHWDICSKQCPGWNGWLPGNDSLWKKFRKKIGDNSTSISIVTKTYPKLPFNVKVTISDLNIRKIANGEKIGEYTGKGTFVIDKTSGEWGHLQNGKGWIYLGNSNYVTIGKTITSKTKSSTNTNKSTKASFNSYLIKITADALNIRSGPGTNYGIVGCIRNQKNKFTIVEEKNNWGLLKSYAKDKDGWISLKYTKKV